MAVVLVVASGCGGDDDGAGSSGALSQEGVDGSDERAEAVFAAYCDNAVKCEKTFGQTADECFSDLDIGWSTFSSQDSETCRDAALDARACYATVSCEQYETACDALDDAAFDCE